jgi:hypothetical protein
METIQEAKEVVEKEKQERMDRVASTIRQILQQERCRLDLSMIMTAQGNIPNVRVVAEDF